MNLGRLLPIISVLGSLAFPIAGRAQSPFQVTVTSPSLPTLSVSASSFPDLLTNVLNAQNQFAPYTQAAFAASFNFLGLPNTIVATSNANGTVVQISIPGIGFSQTWTGATRNDVQNAVKNFFTKNGTTVEGQFLHYIASASPMAVTDGNPNSSTAKMAGGSFTQFGFTPVAESMAAQTPSTSGSGTGTKPNLSGFGLGLDSGHFTAGGVSGSNSEFDIPFAKQLSDRVSLVGSIPLDYLAMGGAKVFGVGLILGVPVRIVSMAQDQPWAWRLTPMGGGSVRASADLAGGGFIWNVGLTSCVGYRVAGVTTLELVDQYAIYKSATVTYAGNKFNPNVDQGILKNGVRLSSRIAPRLLYDLFVVETNFTNAAAVKRFTTLGGSLSFLTGKRFNLTLGANFDNGPAFNAWSVGLSSAWGF